MKVDDFKKLQMEEVIYDKRTFEPFIVKSQFSIEKIEFKDEDSLGILAYDGSKQDFVQLKDCEHWEIASDESPDRTIVKILMARISHLESFVYSRLK